MSVCYLEVDDEITDAVARLRAARDGRVVVVLPPGSRIGTSRINFRLLAREAEGRGIAIALVSGDTSVRALAVSAGMLVHGTVAEAEAALGLPIDGSDGSGSLREVQHSAPAGSEPRVDQERSADGPSAARTVPPTAGASTVGAAAGTAASAAAAPPPAPSALPNAPAVAAAPVISTQGQGAISRPPFPPTGFVAGAPGGPDVPGGSVGSVSQSSTSGFAVTPRATAASVTYPGGFGDPMLADPRALEAAERARAKRHGRSHTRRLVGIFIRLALIVAVLGAAAYGAYLYLPTASITVTPTTHQFGPLTVTVTADPTVAVKDTAAGLVPAERVPIPLSATDSFTASGTQVNLTKATGTIRFTSQNTVTDVIVPDGTKVSTNSGVDFETTQPTTLPRATVSGTTITPSTANTPIRALKAGPDGNVDADTITALPPVLDQVQVKGTNPQPTIGGKKTQSPVVTRTDYDNAVQVLTRQLQAQLGVALKDPATTPRGLTLFPETGTLGKVTTDKTASDVVGSATGSFDLTAESSSSALAVDQAQIEAVAATQLIDSAPKDVQVFADTVKTQVSPGIVNGDRLVFEVTATAQQYDQIDKGALTQQIRGKTVSEARSILAAYGTVEVSVWPDFIPTIPDDTRRINLVIEDPQISQ
jgi:hypothetical protein